MKVFLVLLVFVLGVQVAYAESYENSTLTSPENATIPESEIAMEQSGNIIRNIIKNFMIYLYGEDNFWKRDGDMMRVIYVEYFLVVVVVCVVYFLDGKKPALVSGIFFGSLVSYIICVFPLIDRVPMPIFFVTSMGIPLVIIQICINIFVKCVIEPKKEEEKLKKKI